MTATQVRVFTPPRALGETLEQPVPEVVSSPEPRIRTLPTVPKTNGVSGVNAVNGVNGVNGAATNGVNGVNGTNGASKKADPSPLSKQAYPRIPPVHYRKMPAERGITFAGQETLPKLPIPELEQTCDRYLAALKPLQSYREHADTKHAVREFLKNEGPDLQEKLKKYALEKTSYIEQFCKFCLSRACTLSEVEMLKKTEKEVIPLTANWQGMTRTSTLTTQWC